MLVVLDGHQHATAVPTILRHCWECEAHPWHAIKPTTTTKKSCACHGRKRVMSGFVPCVAVPWPNRPHQAAHWDSGKWLDTFLPPYSPLVISCNHINLAAGCFLPCRALVVL